jgi:Na+-driven multidrug efflux pump
LLPASLIFGWLYEAVGSAYAFMFSGSCAAVAFLLMAFWVNPTPTGQTQPL